MHHREDDIEDIHKVRISTCMEAAPRKIDIRLRKDVMVEIPQAMAACWDDRDCTEMLYEVCHVKP